MNDSMKPTVGVLPLVLELYRRYNPELEKKQAPFIEEVAASFRAFSDVAIAPVCATSEEIRRAIRGFEQDDTDLIVILFIAYATSISALNPLLETRIPLLLFSTAPRSSMAEGMTMEDISLNHGVHGYMDLANVLRRNGRRFRFVAGTKNDPDAMRGIEQWARAAQVQKRLRRSTIGLVGYTFDGMGDFGIDTTTLNAVLGPSVRHIPLNVLAEAIQGIPEKELNAESARDRERFDISDGVDDDILRESNRVYLGLSKVIDDLSLNAFTMHFQGILEHPGIRTLPFLAISKLQEQGLAYAGEGDLLGATANLMARCLCGDTLFTEPFCPDYDGGRIVMGHMGESNPAMGTQTTLRRKKFAFGEALDPVIADVTMPAGERATVVNLGIVEDGAFQLVVYTGEICERIPCDPSVDMPFFHFRPDMALPGFLTSYGEAGGTHHVAMTMGDRTDSIVALAELLDIDLVLLG